MISSRYKSILFLATVIAYVSASQSPCAEYHFETIVLSGDIATGSGGSGPDVPFIGFDNYAVLNSAGEVAFAADTAVNADGDDSGVFSTTGGSLHTVAFNGQIAPGSGGSGVDMPFIGFLDVVLNDVGEVAFLGGTSHNADGGWLGIFSTAGGALHAEAFMYQIAPGSGGSESRALPHT